MLKSGPRLLSNLSLSLMVSLISRVTGIVLFFVISRRVTASGVGVYALAMTYVALLLSATSLGHNDPITRERITSVLFLMGDRNAQALCQTALKDKNPRVRWKAVPASMNCGRQRQVGAMNRCASARS